MIDGVKRLDKAIGGEELSAASLDVLAERHRQIDVEGWTACHDDAHDKGELAKAAACYALRATGFKREALWSSLWPQGWSLQWLKEGPSRRMLVKAAALIIAEIERIDRAPKKGEGHGD